MEEFDWKTPVNSEIAALAKSFGEELLGNPTGKYPKGRSCDYRSVRLRCGHIQDVRVVNYRTGKTECRQCFEDNVKSIGLSQGLTLKSMDIIRHCNERVYIRECGHEEIFSHSYLLKHKIGECRICVHKDIAENAIKNNMEFIGTVRKGYVLKCNKCGNEMIARLDVARDSKPFCTVCFEEQLRAEAQFAGFTYDPSETKIVKTKSRSTVYRSYICNTCGHKDFFGHFAMKLKNVSCDKCYLSRLESEAITQELKYLGYFKGQLHRYEMPCGCTRELTTFAARAGIYACKIHDNTHYHRKSGIYLLKITVGDFSWLKFGFAKDVAVRLRGYGLPENHFVEHIIYKDMESGYAALELEKKIHRQFNNVRLDPKFMKKYMTSTGHTECYPENMLEDIKSAIANQGEL